MEKRLFGKTGLEVSVIGFGGAPVGYLDTDQQRIERILKTLLGAGVNLIDTAASYPGSEEAIGKALKKSHARKDLVLVSKCGQAFEDLPGKEWSGELITATIDRSLKRLQTDYLDVMLLHSCDLEVLKRGEAMAALAAARDAGKIRFAGYSGDNEDAAYAAGLKDVAVIETSVNIFDQANIDALLPVTLKHGIGVIAKRPLGNTAWRAPEQMQGIYRDYAKTYHERYMAMNMSPRELGFFTDEDWPEIALRFTISHPGVHVAIIGTTNPSNGLKNTELAERGPLDKVTLAKLREAFASAAKGKDWPGLT